MVIAGTRFLAAALLTACSAPAHRSETVANPNWAGHVAIPGLDPPAMFESASGTWRQPAAACRRGEHGAAAAIWVGIGGYDGGSDELQQIGSTVGCDRRGRPFSTAWFALLPYPPHPIAHKVRSGDTLAGAVTVLPTAVRLQLIDRTAGWSFTRTIGWGPADTTSAEWIVEAPVNCVYDACRQAPLANFHSLTFTEIAASTSAGVGTLAHSPWAGTDVALTLTPAQTGTARTGTASAGPLDPDGTSFTVRWSPPSTGHKPGTVAETVRPDARPWSPLQPSGDQGCAAALSSSMPVRTPTRGPTSEALRTGRESRFGVGSAVSGPVTGDPQLQVMRRRPVPIRYCFPFDSDTVVNGGERRQR